MKDPLLEVYETLINNDDLLDYVDSDYIFSIRVPEDYQKRDNAPILRINETTYERAGWSDNAVRYFDAEIQIDIWGKDIKTITEVSYLLDEILADKDYRQNKGTTDFDDDIELFRKVRRYKTQKLFEGEN